MIINQFIFKILSSFYQLGYNFNIIMCRWIVFKKCRWVVFNCVGELSPKTVSMSCLVDELSCSRIFDLHNFSLFRSRSHPVPKEKVSAQSNLWEQMSKIDFQDGGCDGHLGFSIGSFNYFVSHKRPNTHQVSIQLDYSGDVQNMNSQHFSHINV